MDFVISTICEYDISIQTVQTILQLLPKYRFYWDFGATTSYNRAKNQKWTNFLLHSDAPYILNIDRDMVFATQDVDYLLEDLKEHDLVGGAYATHNGMQITAWGTDGEGIEFDGTLKEVKWLSQGFCGISRGVLRKIVDEFKLPLLHEGTAQQMYPFCVDSTYEDDSFGTIWKSEDYYFCDLCKQVGVNPILDTRLHIGHMGGVVWYPEHSAGFQGTNKINDVKNMR